MMARTPFLALAACASIVCVARGAEPAREGSPATPPTSTSVPRPPPHPSIPGVASDPVWKQFRDAYHARGGKGIAVARYRESNGDPLVLVYCAETAALIQVRPTLLVVRDRDGLSWRTTGEERRKLVPGADERSFPSDAVLDDFMSEPIARDFAENPAVLDSVTRLADGSFEIEAHFPRGNRGARRDAPNAEFNPLHRVRYRFDANALLTERSLPDDDLVQRYVFDPRLRPGLEFVAVSEFAGRRVTLESLEFLPSDAIRFDPAAAVAFAREQVDRPEATRRATLEAASMNSAATPSGTPSPTPPPTPPPTSSPWSMITLIAGLGLCVSALAIWWTRRRG